MQYLLVLWALIGQSVANGSYTNRSLQGGVGNKNLGDNIKDKAQEKTQEKVEELGGGEGSLNDLESSSNMLAKKKKKVAFGTQNGYDAGGTDPLCWISPFLKNETILSSGTYNNEIELLNEQLFEDADGTNLLPACPSSTSMTVTPLNINENTLEMLMGKPYDFLVELTMNLTELDGRVDVAALEGVASVHYRLHVCDAVRQGFCNPIRDTRQRDATMTRAEADIGDFDEFPDTENKWAYSEDVPLNGLQDEEDDTAYFARWCKWKFREDPSNPGIFRSKISVKLQLPLPENGDVTPRPYFLIAQAVLHFDIGPKRAIRLDVSQTTPNKVVYVKSPPNIATVSQGAKIFLGVVIGIFGAFALFCFAAIVAYQKHNVMRMAQGSFLATMAAA